PKQEVDLESQKPGRALSLARPSNLPPALSLAIPSVRDPSPLRASRTRETMSNMEKHLFSLKFAAKELNRNAKKCDKEEKAEKAKIKKIPLENTNFSFASGYQLALNSDWTWCGAVYFCQL
ncbi:Charged multivesicular body protein 1b-2, partial [Lemmus lemmus]